MEAVFSLLKENALQIAIGIAKFLSKALLSRGGITKQEQAFIDFLELLESMLSDQETEKEKTRLG